MRNIVGLLLLVFSFSAFAHTEWNVSCFGSTTPFTMDYVIAKDAKKSRITLYRDNKIFHEVDGSKGCNSIVIHQDNETTHAVARLDENCHGSDNEMVASVYETTTQKIIATFVYYHPEGIDFAHMVCKPIQ